MLHSDLSLSGLGFWVKRHVIMKRCPLGRILSFTLVCIPACCIACFFGGLTRMPEQGPILENTGRKIGIVMGAQAFRWYTITVLGRDCHAGSTPFSARSDAMLCAAKVIVLSNTIAKKFKAVASTGIIHAYPGSTNTVPGRVVLSMDMRHPDNEVLAAMAEELQREAEKMAKDESERGCTLQWRKDVDSAATYFHQDCIQSVRESAEATVGKDMMMEITSGAGHDR